MSTGLCGVVLACFICVSRPSTIQAQEPARTVDLQHRLVIGTVVAVNADQCLITIRQSNLVGYFRINLRSYAVVQASALAGFRPGDRIRASFSTSDGKLHRLHHVENRPVLRPEAH